MINEETKRTVEETVEALSKLPLTEIMKVYGFVLGLQANQPAA
jgi:hypothetical protein